LIEFNSHLMSIRKRLFYDIETSYFIVSAWRMGEQRLGPHQIIKHPEIICISWKWEEEDKVYRVSWNEDQSDKELLEKFIPELNKANQIVAHNGDRFDLKWIRGRAIFHDIKVNPRYETIDTLKIAKSQFKFASNKLDELGKFLGVGEKIETNYALWDRIILSKEPEALEEMGLYCDEDVRLLERVFEKLRPYGKAQFNYGKLYGDHNFACPECGALTPRVTKAYTTPMGVRRYYLQCKAKGCFTNYPVSNRTYIKMVEYQLKNSSKKP